MIESPTAQETVYFFDDLMLVDRPFLQRLFGVTESSVMKYKFKEKRKYKRKSYYDLFECKEWHDRNIKSGKREKPKEPSDAIKTIEEKDQDEGELKRRTAYEVLLKKRKENKIQDGEYISVEEIDKSMASLGATLKANLVNMEKASSAEMENRSSDEILKIMQDNNDELHDRLDKLIKKEFKCNETMYDAITSVCDAILDGQEPDEIIKKIHGVL